MQIQETIWLNVSSKEIYMLSFKSHLNICFLYKNIYDRNIWLNDKLYHNERKRYTKII